MNANELALHRLNTKAFIDSDPTTIVLVPRLPLKTGTGTKLVDQAPRVAQVFKVIDQTRTFGPEPGSFVGADGKSRRIEYQLLGEYNATVGLYDYWVDAAGIRFEVVDLLPDNEYERRAQVVRYGES